jgi:hypothetical protein
VFASNPAANGRKANPPMPDRLSLEASVGASRAKRLKKTAKTSPRSVQASLRKKAMPAQVSSE